MWPFKRNRKVATVKATYELRPDGKLVFSFVSQVETWKQKEIERLSARNQNALGSCVQALHHHCAAFGNMLHADVDEANAFERQTNPELN